MKAPISQYQIELLARARARIAKSQVRYGEKIAYPADMKLMLDLAAQVESLTSAMESEAALSSSESTEGMVERLRALLKASAPAIDNLTHHQEQCDMDGVMVKVSRQAVHETLEVVNQIDLVLHTIPLQDITPLMPKSGLRRQNHEHRRR